MTIGSATSIDPSGRILILGESRRQHRNVVISRVILSQWLFLQIIFWSGRIVNVMLTCALTLQNFSLLLFNVLKIIFIDIGPFGINLFDSLVRRKSGGRFQWHVVGQSGLEKGLGLFNSLIHFIKVNVNYKVYKLLTSEINSDKLKFLSLYYI